MELDHIDFIVAHPKDYFGILQLTKDADEVAIKKSYRRLMLQLHPDKVLSSETIHSNELSEDEKEELKKKVELACQYVQHSYEVLKEKEIRDVYVLLGAYAADQYQSTGVSPWEQMRQIKDRLLFNFTKVVSHWTQQQDLVFVKYPEIGKEYIETLRELDPPSAEVYDYYCSTSATRRRIRRRVWSWFWKLLVVLIVTVVAVSYFFAPNDTERVNPKGEPFLIHKKAWRFSLSHWNPYDVDAWSVYHDQLTRLPNCTGAQDDCLWVTCTHPICLSEKAFIAYSLETCSIEQALFESSRERYEVSSTLQYPSQERSPPERKETAKATSSSKERRKYEKKRWHFRFKDFFSVQNETELFRFSPFCEALLS